MTLSAGLCIKPAQTCASADDDERTLLDASLRLQHFDFELNKGDGSDENPFGLVLDTANREVRGSIGLVTPDFGAHLAFPGEVTVPDDESSPLGLSGHLDGGLTAQLKIAGGDVDGGISCGAIRDLTLRLPFPIRDRDLLEFLIDHDLCTDLAHA